MLKKIYAKNSPYSREQARKASPAVRVQVDDIRQYTPPVYRENGAGNYVEFYAYDPELGSLRRKTIKINRIEGAAKRRRYARDLIARLNEQLQRGWNPWIAKDSDNLSLFEEAAGRYESYIEKMMADGLFRKETYAGYKSYMKMMRRFISKSRSVHYTYQFDRRFCNDFLDWVFIERNRCAQTRNNYLNFLRVFSGFLVEKGYLNARPTDGIQPISKRLFTKSRTDIPLKVVGEIARYCESEDPHFLLACYLLYYCFIRPVEMTRLKIRDINVRECTIVVREECSKNRRTQTVTVPKKVMEYMLKLGVLSAPVDDYLFSERLKPGSSEIDPKIFRDRWAKVRTALRLRSEWKFYSLKDTGITEMCDNNLAMITVRDQARHSSLAMTDIYTRHRGKVNSEIIDHEGSL